ncbi:hypothetical protein G6F65_021051 [Rhizopus arrhizus]|nr:hypothetical protein G6F65_021051 [Rhizopus arrhizus]
MADTMPAAMPTSTAMAMLASITEIQACDRTDVLQQLDGRRLVQPIRHAQAFDQRRVGDLLLGRHDVQERAGHGLDQGEVQHHHAQQQRNGLEQAAQDQTQRHGGSLTLAARRRPGFRPGRWRRCGTIGTSVEARRANCAASALRASGAVSTASLPTSASISGLE